MLVHIGRIVNKNILGKYALPAFNTSDLEMTQGIVRAAEAQKAPIVIQTSVGALEYAGLEQLVGIIKQEAREAKVPIALHQDHCHDFDLIKQLIAHGYSSVMVDASHLPYEENLKLTRAVVAYAHKRGVWVQAELGRILGNEDWQNVKSGDDLMTDPEQAVQFVKDTGIDTLAIAVGSVHGIPVDPRIKKVLSTLKEHVDIERVKAIRKKIKIPLVMHGASGVPDPQIRAAIRHGVAIFNIDTDLRVAFNNALRDNIKKHPQIYDPRKLFKPATDALQAAAEKKIKLMKCNGKAKNFKK
ncbi:MAG: class II fructose-bisphosphate aldolase [Candidatus Doudnabacteria bacterium]|nr:class II fructose-bisphosphate aldolase [Candidatus Doudnabacteria bacterium]